MRWTEIEQLIKKRIISPEKNLDIEWKKTISKTKTETTRQNKSTWIEKHKRQRGNTLAIEKIMESVFYATHRFKTKHADMLYEEGNEYGPSNNTRNDTDHR